MADYVLDEQVGYLLRLASQRHTNLFQSKIPNGVTPTQFATMMRLSEQGICSQNQLGRLAGMDVATIKGVVDRLRQKGLAEVAQDPDDKRRALISLSASGHQMIEQLQVAGHEISKMTLAPLSADEQRAFLAALRKIT